MQTVSRWKASGRYNQQTNQHPATKQDDAFMVNSRLVVVSLELVKKKKVPSGLLFFAGSAGKPPVVQVQKNINSL